MRRLRYDSSWSLAQLKHSLRIGLSFTDTNKDRTDWILRSTEVERWLAADQSCALVVNAREPLHETNSPASFFSALLISTLKDAAAPTALLYWFCSQNMERNVQSMLKTSIGQLLEAGLTTDFPSLPDEESELYFEDLVHFFCRCIRAQMLHTPVYCIMDSLSCYEDQRRIDDLRYFCDELSKLVQSESQSPNPFKVLATSPIQTTCFRARSGRPHEVLNVPEVTGGSGNHYSQLTSARTYEDYPASR